MQSNQIKTESPIFIVGPGRSGTTLMQKILSAHSRISITPETHFMKRIDEIGNIHGVPEDFEEFWKEYTSWIRFTYLDIDADYCLKLIEQSGDRTFQNIFRTVMTAYKEKNGKEREGEKSPSHVRYLSILLKWFPNARVIIMQRDPRAVVASKLGTPWVQDRITSVSLRRGVFSGSRWKELILGADAWAKIFEEIVPEWKEDSRIHVVSYEELCYEPEREVRSICRFLGETFEEEMLTERKRKNVATPSVKTQDARIEQWTKHHKKTQDPISTDSLNKWEKNLSKIEIAMVESLCIDGMKKRGYTPTGPPLKNYLYKTLCSIIIFAEVSETRTRKLFRQVRRKLQ